MEGEGKLGDDVRDQTDDPCSGPLFQGVDVERQKKNIGCYLATHSPQMLGCQRRRVLVYSLRALYITKSQNAQGLQEDHQPSQSVPNMRGGATG